jgi:hypothetical protein
MLTMFTFPHFIFPGIKMTTSAAVPSRFSTLTTRPAILSGALFVLGSLLFLAGGRHHPSINASLGSMGSLQFYQAFSDTVRAAPHWEAIHDMILLGPVLWALAASGVHSILPRVADPLWAVARTALTLGAAAWVVAFALDGHNARAYADAIAAATDPATLADKAFQFSISTRLVGYFGRLGWMLVSIPFAAYGAGLLLGKGASVWRKILGSSGVLLGLWMVFELLRGHFTPAPFTSQYWLYTALATGVWTIAFGMTIALSRERPNPTT